MGSLNARDTSVNKCPMFSPKTFTHSHNLHGYPIRALPNPPQLPVDSPYISPSQMCQAPSVLCTHTGLQLSQKFSSVSTLCWYNAWQLPEHRACVTFMYHWTASLSEQAAHMLLFSGSNQV